MATILPEVWTLIGTHLPPRHLFKLLCTSKQVSNAVDNHDYWTRAFAQLIWRDFESMEIHPCGPSDFDVMPRVPMDLYNIPRTDGDYHMLMTSFFARMEEMREVYTKGAEQMVAEKNGVCLFGHNMWDPILWKHAFTLPLHERNIFFFNAVTVWQHSIRIRGDERFVPQKEMTRRSTLAAHEEERAAARAGETFRLFLARQRAAGRTRPEDIYAIYSRYRRILGQYKVPNVKHRTYWHRVRHGIVEE